MADPVEDDPKVIEAGKRLEQAQAWFDQALAAQDDDLNWDEGDPDLPEAADARKALDQALSALRSARDAARDRAQKIADDKIGEGVHDFRKMGCVPIGAGVALVVILIAAFVLWKGRDSDKKTVAGPATVTTVCPPPTTGEGARSDGLVLIQQCLTPTTPATTGAPTTSASATTTAAPPPAPTLDGTYHLVLTLVDSAVGSGVECTAGEQDVAIVSTPDELTFDFGGGSAFTSPRGAGDSFAFTAPVQGGTQDFGGQIDAAADPPTITGTSTLRFGDQYCAYTFTGARIG
jgi:hypothetical protein